MKFRSLLLALFLVSGATALVYQVLWLRLLSIAFGATTAAVGTVLTCFMLGLAIGAWAFGRVADRLERPLLLYAGLEIGIAVSALALPVVLRSLTPLYASVYASESMRWLLPATRLALTSVILLVPCTLMGGTLPVLVRFAARVPERFGQHFGWLYGMNTAGAMLGSLLGGVYLLGKFGVIFTNNLAASANVILAIAFLAIDRRARQTAPPASSESRKQPHGGLAFEEKLVVAIAALSGFTILGLEVLWTRALVHALRTTTETFAIILATVLLSLAAGSFLAARAKVPLDDGAARSLLMRLAVVELGFAVCLLATLPLLGQLVDFHFIYRAHVGQPLEMVAKFLTASVLMLLPATVAGMLFPLSTRILSRRMATIGESLGTLYMLNALASALGALVFGFVLLPALGVAKTYLGVILVHIAVAALFGYIVSHRRSWLLAPALVAMVSVYTLASVDRPDLFNYRLFASPELGMKLLAHRESADATFAVYEHEDTAVRQLYINGFMATESSELVHYMPMMAHLPLLLHDAPARALVIAFGTGSTAGAASIHPIERLDIVDISDDVYELSEYFSDANHDVLLDPRVNAIVEDGRNHVDATRERYDVITSEPMPPKFAGMINFYTREYYEAARERLTDNGVVCQWLPFHLMSLDDVRMASRTFLDVFPNSSLWQFGGAGLLVGTKRPTPLTEETLSRGFRHAAVRADLARLGFPSPKDVLGTLILDAKGLSILAEGAPLLTDDKPYMEFSGEQPIATDLESMFEAIGRAQRQSRSAGRTE
jgi:spermidine synthase